jgi:hypothetical protein
MLRADCACSCSFLPRLFKKSLIDSGFQRLTDRRTTCWPTCFPWTESGLIASCSFALATWRDRNRGTLYYLAPLAFALTALRLAGRLLGMFGGQTWLDSLSYKIYFPAVFVANALLMIWFFGLAGERANDWHETWCGSGMWLS